MRGSHQLLINQHLSSSFSNNDCAAASYLTKIKVAGIRNAAMSRYAKIQFLGPALVFLAVLMAEGAAFGLAHMPTSEILWRVNLEFFTVFQSSHYLLYPALDLPYAQLWIIAVPLFAVATYGLVSGRQIALAIASNLSFIYTAFLICSEFSFNAHPMAASLTEVAVPVGQGNYLPLVLAGVGLMSFSASHCCYIRRIFAR